MLSKEQEQELLARVEKDNEVAARIVQESGGTIPFISAVIMAGDLGTAERAWSSLTSGEVDVPTALIRVGSYARLDFAVKAAEAGYLSEDELLDVLIEQWSGSDPNDTNPHFLLLWKKAYARNGNRYVRDGKALPKGDRLIVYRGQMEDERQGIAWTLDPHIATKFARGAGLRVSSMPGTVFMGQIERRRILAYLTDRGESEVILDPMDLTPVARR